MTRALPLVAVLSLLACGGGKPVCSPTNCGGCCDPTGQCLPGVNPTACGAAGAMCSVCSGNQQCQSGACSGAAGTGGNGDLTGGGGGSGANGGGNIEGGGGGTSAGSGGGTSIGSGGGTSTGSGGGDEGTGGGGDTGCNAQTCPFGCCTGSTCNAGEDSSACGSGGHTCAICGSGLSCMSQACQPMQACSPTTCPNGCCSNGQCVTGADNGACGSGGHTCAVCGSGTACSSHACQPTAACGPQSCSSGCCQSGQCVAGTDPGACGRGGGTCTTCSAGDVCSNQACGPNTGCSPSTCPNGCCQNGQCVAGTTGPACGAGGNACGACNGNQACLGGQCLDLTGSCGAQSCTGCCSQGVCLPGADNNACGLNGAACQSCSGLLGCLSGLCINFPLTGGGGDAGTGEPCTDDSQCASEDFFSTTGTCNTATGLDGGASGWPGGYCTSTCTFGGCAGNGICLTDGCAEYCTSPGAGRATCRTGYVCEQLFDTSDGGLIAGEGACEPDCRNAGVTCLSNSHCGPLGYCQ